MKENMEGRDDELEEMRINHNAKCNLLCEVAFLFTILKGKN